MRAWGRLLRLSLAPSAAADVAAGVLVGAGEWPRGPEPFAVIAGSLCVYHGGMALNDWADRADDARLRSDRPIPSGAIAPRAALAVAALLLIAGPLVALAGDVRSGAVLGAVAVLAALYDVAGRGAWRGPALLAACRGGNLLAGVALGVAWTNHRVHMQWLSFEPMLYGVPRSRWEPAVPVVLGYGAYVLVVSRLGRLEDAEDEHALAFRPRRLLWTAAALLAAAPLLARAWRFGGFEHARLELVAAVAVACAGAAGILRASRVERWTRGDVLRAMGVSLRRLLVLTAAVALAVGGADAWLVSGAILAGFPLAYALRGVFPPS